MTMTSPKFGGPQNGWTTAIVTVGALVTAAFWTAPASAAPAGACSPGDVAISALAEWNHDRACDLTGRTVRAGRIAAVIPPRGTSVTAHALFVDGDEELTLTTAADGAVTAAAKSTAAQTSTSTGTGTTKAAAAPAACNDHASNAMGMQWPAGSTYRWSYHPDNQLKSQLTAADALAATKQATVSVVTGHNDCGLTAEPNIYQAYAGTTTSTPDVTNAGGCAASDGSNVSGWGDMGASGPLAVTCNWAVSGTTVASDLKVNFRYGYWNGEGTCPAGRFDLQSVATHERGHTFGLGHVDGTAHSNDTMTPGIGACNTSKRTLAAGEHDALISFYGRR